MYVPLQCAQSRSTAAAFSIDFIFISHAKLRKKRKKVSQSLFSAVTISCNGVTDSRNQQQ
jgi:hypothetical protein